MYHVSPQGVEEHMINVHYYYYVAKVVQGNWSIAVTGQIHDCLHYH